MRSFEDGRSKAETTTRPSVPEYEHFPADTYCVACAVAVSRDDLLAFRELIERETATTAAVEQSTFLSREIEYGLDLQQTEADLAAFVHELVETWEGQLDGDSSAVWWPLESDWRVALYVRYCRARAEHETDEFDCTEQIERVQMVVSRCESAAENAAKRGIVHRDHVPGERAER
ncbi:hypothetical protein EL22_15175 [Halostagnicola sp. A56]|uniref:hypothetical protein n=1 Tax=Halostagnicola sp. A56 TaxID=1495067 RepID=UPI00049F31EF|nr:hypothetical protein [Halostagnicola sp. A56]KDE59919.1 hypothetical protein EL22_15175 [Halostagnicola sp. A56]